MHCSTVQPKDKLARDLSHYITLRQQASMTASRINEYQTGILVTTSNSLTCRQWLTQRQSFLLCCCSWIQSVIPCFSWCGRCEYLVISALNDANVTRRIFLATVSNGRVFKAVHLTQFRSRAIYATNIAQGSVATCLRKDGIFSHQFTTNSSLSLSVKEFWKPVNS